MHTRKHSVGRSILRAFEIALFFAVSAFGYGLLVKASSFNTKSKNRDRESIAFQNAVDLKGFHRELTVLSGTLLFPEATATTRPNRYAVANLALASIHPLPTLARHLLSGNEHAYHYLNGSTRLPRPCNLLEQNPVLLN
jgi:hypothetical protein